MLEVGVGSGVNLPLYGPAVTRVVGLEERHGLCEPLQHGPSSVAIDGDATLRIDQLGAIGVNMAPTNWTASLQVLTGMPNG